jgi:tol-pal system protein YbgF
MKPAKPFPAKLFVAAAASALLLGAACQALAQDDGPSPNQAASYQKSNDKRLQRIEKDLHELRSIVLQAKETGQPVQVRTASSDDQIIAMQAKLDDIDQTVRGMTGQIEVLSHDLDEAKKSVATTHDQTVVMADRLDKLEKQVESLAAPPPPPPGPTAEASPPQAQDAAPGDAGGAYTHARQLLLNGEYPAAADAFQSFIDTYPQSPTVPAAHYWLGGIKYTQGDYNAAALNMIGAIRGWPKTTWAPDAVVKLALSLVQQNKAADACGALSEFSRHYPTANAAAKQHVAAARVKAGCAG